MPEGACGATDFTALAAAQISPSLRKLTAGGPALSMSNSALLARAVLAHPTLTDLDVSLPEAPQLRAFTAAVRVAALPNLSTFQISVRPSAAACAALADCLSSLQAITKLTVVLFLECANAARTPAPTLKAFTGAAPCRATLPCLKHLTICEALPGPDLDPDADASLTPLLLPMIDAPALSRMAIFAASARLSHASLLAGAARFRGLQHATLYAASSVTWTAADEAPAVHATECASFEALAELVVQGQSHEETLHLAAAAAGRACGTLTDLSVCSRVLCKSWPPCRASTFEGGGRAAEQLWRQLSRCGRLERLHIDFLSWTGAGDAAGVRGHSQAMADGLAQLRSLTALTLSAGAAAAAPEGGCKLDGAVLGAALAQMTGLWAIDIRHGAWKGSEAGAGAELELLHADEFLAACTKLPSLQDLKLGVLGPTLRHVAEVLPQLQGLTGLALLDTHWWGDTEGEVGMDEELEERYPSISFGAL